MNAITVLQYAITVLHDLWLPESLNVEPKTHQTNYKNYTRNFNRMSRGKASVLNPCVVQGSTVIISILQRGYYSKLSQQMFQKEATFFLYNTIYFYLSL